MGGREAKREVEEGVECERDVARYVSTLLWGNLQVAYFLFGQTCDFGYFFYGHA